MTPSEMAKKGHQNLIDKYGKKKYKEILLKRFKKNQNEKTKKTA